MPGRSEGGEKIEASLEEQAVDGLFGVIRISYILCATCDFMADEVK